MVIWSSKSVHTARLLGRMERWFTISKRHTDRKSHTSDTLSAIPEKVSKTILHTRHSLFSSPKRPETSIHTSKGPPNSYLTHKKSPQISRQGHNRHEPLHKHLTRKHRSLIRHDPSRRFSNCLRTECRHATLPKNRFLDAGIGSVFLLRSERHKLPICV